MALLAVQTAGARLGVQGDAAVVTVGQTVALRKPLHEVDEVHLYGDVDLTAAARRELLRRGVDVVLLTGRGGYLGRLVGPDAGSAERRVAQVRWLIDPDNAHALARTLVAAKLFVQRSLLVRVARSDPARAHPAAIASLRVLHARTADAPTVEALRGLEGQGAALYFRGLAAALGDPRFRFDRRTRRPPLDPVNACLSFGYTLLLRKAEAALLRAGLDPGLGALHGPSRGKPALALDLIEPWRPLAVDRLVLRLVNRRQLDPEEDFEEPWVSLDQVGAPPSPGDDPPPPDAAPDAAAAPAPPVRACYLAERGRTVLLRAWGDLWRKAVHYPPRDGRFALGAILAFQAADLAHLFEGRRDAFEPYLPR